jgi:tRNA-specific adenosine deaminase 2
MLLRKFYVQENEKAPEPKQKKTRELKTEILPMDIHAPKSTPSPALPKSGVATPLVAVPIISSVTAAAAP